MGLAERSEMAAFKNDTFASKVAELKEAAAGADIQVTLDEASFTTVAAIQMLSNGVFDRLIDDMKSVCSDAIGKQAVREGIQTLHIVHKDAPGFTLDLTDGTLTLRAKVDGSLGEDLPGYGTYRAFLLKKL
ncbi:hypothetical protein [Corallococcus exiguus]|uniref:Uncharacterized protein n=1 Tax=Corallococcus exiguus TaxID=83462 RepID=A0A7X4Y6Q5_9BACT|nr:hypothetical protein [Corallococcus exiguus]NBC39935.1 hypothetical protein [Corallococcus exiguus]TNV64309.1 hypothetical protein FH620_12890 [Corallococcus exiguus]